MGIAKWLLSAAFMLPVVALADRAPVPLDYNRQVPTPIYGVTLDDVGRINRTVESLANLAKVPTTRVVFDEYQPASEYVTPVVKIRPVSYVMGELLDSFYVKRYSVQAYTNRSVEYLSTLGNYVDIWEIGNEINGEWLGSTPDVVAKLTSAYNIFKSAGKPVAITLYYNENCWSKKSNEMFTWAKNNIPDNIKQNTDYILVSYYEEDCNNLKPDWQSVFTELHTIFPNSKLGFGEVGTSKKAKKEEYLLRYYSIKPNVPNFVGGYFWWYFKQDMVPYTKDLWNTLNNAFIQY